MTAKHGEFQLEFIASDHAAMNHEPASLSPIRVLVCDDIAAIRDLLREVVEVAPNMRVVGEAANGDIAVREASLLQPDVILLDLAMPVLSGLDAIPRIREVAPAAKIIVFAGFSPAIATDQALALGADAYLTKDATAATIIAAIEHAATGTFASA